MIDLVREVRICQCTDQRHAEEITSCMNMQYREREALLVKEAK